MAKSFTTNVAFEGFFFAVDVLVVTEMVLSSEGFSTNVTGEGTFICVGSLMYQQIVTFCKLSAAVLTDVSLLWSVQPTTWTEEEFC